MYDFVDDKPKRPENAPGESPRDAGVLNEGTAMAAMAAMTKDVTQEPTEMFRGHVSEFSISLHGKDHPEALLRAAGGESARRGDFGEPWVIYRCPCCGQTANRVIRVRASRRSAWAGVCAMCAASLLAKNPEAVIGGRVRPSSRRRPKRLRDVG